MEQFTENDFNILKSILDRGDDSKGLTMLNGTTIMEIVKKTNLSDKKVRDSLNNFKEIGYVTEGIKRVRTKTYILTKEGFTFLNQAKKSVIFEED